MNWPWPLRDSAGFTLIEMLLSVAIMSILMIGLGGVVMNTLAVSEVSSEYNVLAGDARFAMDRMVRHIKRTGRLLVPLVEDPSTTNTESLIEPGFFAVTLDPTLDRDLDGFADADNDRDGQVDEDLPGDTSNDNKPGLIGIDDDNSGFADFFLSRATDDDESGIFSADEDPINGADDDGDGSIDEDPPADMNGDGAPGIAGVDDDGDGSIDEGSIDDDDEDGSTDEDWYDAVVYFLSGTNLIERFPNLSPVDGTDYTERIIAENVRLFRVERLPRGINRTDLLDITLGLGTEQAEVMLQQRVRVGGAP